MSKSVQRRPCVVMLRSALTPRPRYNLPIPANKGLGLVGSGPTGIRGGYINIRTKLTYHVLIYAEFRGDLDTSHQLELAAEFLFSLCTEKINSIRKLQNITHTSKG